MPFFYSENTDSKYEELMQHHDDQLSTVHRLFNRIFEFSEIIQDSFDSIYLGLNDDLYGINLKSTYLNASVCLNKITMELDLVIEITLPNHKNIELKFNTPNEEFMNICIDQLMLCIASNYHPYKLQHLQECISQYNDMQSPAERKRARH